MSPAKKVTIALLAGAGLTAAAAAALADGRWHGEGHGGRRGDGAMRMLERLDADGDGAVTRAEALAARSDALRRFDADGDGSLSLDEFEALHAEDARPLTVDRFQMLDEDGDGRVTEAELTAPVDRMTRRMDVDRDGDIDRDDFEARRAMRGHDDDDGHRERRRLND